MSLNFDKAKVNEAQAQAPAAAPTAEPVEAQAPVAAAPEQEIPEGVLNSLRDKIAFVKCLTNPLKDDTTTTVVDGKQDKKVTPFIVGYRFKALADISGIPDCGTTIEFKKNYMNFKDINGKKDVKAGEEFDLTPFETALLASWPEVNGRFLGGEDEAICGFARKSLKSKMSDSSVAAVAEFPRAVLRLAQGSIKDKGWINVCEKSVVMGEDGKERKKGTLNPGFEKWAPLVEATPRSGARSGARAEKKNTYDPAARVFQEIARGKGYVR